MIKQATTDAIKHAANLIKNGEIVAMPTETVYGLAANALDGKAVAKIYTAKERPNFNPLITHISNIDQAKQYAVFNDIAETLATNFWPGPLTIILPKKNDCPISELVTAGLDTIALRIPNHDVAIALINHSECPISAPSANKSGRLSSTSPIHVAKQFGDEIAMVLASGQSEKGLESTIIDVSARKPTLLRAGAITQEDIENIIGRVEIGYNVKEGDIVKSPGLLQKHYAPSIPVRLNAIDVGKDEALLAFGDIKFMGIQGGGFAKNLPDNQIKNLSEDGDLSEAASNLFAYLHELDNKEFTKIAVMNIPDHGLGIAINDRLKRAANGF